MSVEALIALNALPKIGPVRVRRLIEAFGDPGRVLGAPVDHLLRVEGIGRETAEILRRWQDHVDPAAEIREAGERGIHILAASDELYPEPLRQVYDPPLVLYCWGRLESRDKHALAVVGSRRATHYGRQITKKLAFQLAHAGYTILSGFARGIDTAAHEAAVAAPNGRTVAVLGSGLASIYPPENLALAEKIADGHGAVVSEFPLHTAPDKQTFPMRNRIVAAWSRAVLVTESPSWSGSLITANLATEYGKPVFAVPGPADRPSSSGCHDLIRNGATLVTDATQILEDLGELWQREPTAAVKQASSTAPELAAEEEAVWNALSQLETPVDHVIEATGLPAPIVTATLLKLEMRRLVRALPGFRYVKLEPS